LKNRREPLVALAAHTNEAAARTVVTKPTATALLVTKPAATLWWRPLLAEIKKLCGGRSGQAQKQSYRDS